VAREHFHLIGIGGTGMTSLAGLLQAAGCRVTGSDRQLYPPTSEILRALRIEIEVGFDAARLEPSPDVVVIGNAVSRGNHEVEAVLDRDLPFQSMPALIAERFLRGKHPIVITGTHGKTTMASMLAWVLTEARRAPGFLIGGQPCNFDRSFRLAEGEAFVIEGDEYDTAFFDKGPKFMHYRPRTAVVGTVEFDHADIYADLGQVETAFRRFVNIVPGNGLIVRHEDCAVTRGVTAEALARVQGFGVESGSWRALDLHDSPDGIRFRVLHCEESFAEVRLRLSGVHNAMNALAVIAAAYEQGLDATEIARGLASFRGVKRRMELRGVVDGVTVLDDFAHHPTAIAATLGAVRHRFPGRRIWAICEPRSWSLRRNVFQERLVDALEAADEIVLAAVFGSAQIDEGERLDPDRLVAELGQRGRSARFVPGVDEIVSLVSRNAVSSDVVVVMSNGSFDGLHERILDTLGARSRAPRTA
jgi:UDP-N-acetylmuramate: L-alanyl-gamma-D-glutamyl-meso-diaminopimelate ligase